MSVYSHCYDFLLANRSRGNRAGPGDGDRVPRLQVQHVPLQVLGKTRRAAHRTRAAAGPFRQPHAGPRERRLHRELALLALRRPSVLRHVPAAAPVAGAQGPGAFQRGVDQGFRIIPRPADGQNVVRARRFVQQRGEPEGREVESRQGQVDPHVHHFQAEGHV